MRQKRDCRLRTPTGRPRAWGSIAVRLPVGRGIHTHVVPAQLLRARQTLPVRGVLLFVQHAAVLLLTSSFCGLRRCFIAFGGHLRGGGSSTKTPLYSKHKFLRMSGLYFWKQNCAVLIRGCGCSCQMENSPCLCCCPGRRLWAEALPCAVTFKVASLRLRKPRVALMRNPASRNPRRGSQSCCWETFGFESSETEAQFLGVSSFSPFSSVHVSTDEELSCLSKARAKRASVR